MTKISGSILLLLGLFCFSNAAAQVATGGTYTLDRAVIASGGGTSADGGSLYKIDGTAGSTRGNISNAGAYSIRGGFWSPDPLAPSAANASIGGRVVDAAGAGLRNITVTLSGGNLSAPRITLTSSLGYFTFDDISVGETYILSVENKKYSFQQPVQVVMLMDNISDIIFQGVWGN